MVIDATARFARRTAQWMINSSIEGTLSRENLADRLKMFNDTHKQLITEQASDIKGKRIKPK